VRASEAAGARERLAGKWQWQANAKNGRSIGRGSKAELCPRALAYTRAHLGLRVGHVGL
jgi:hypothetical protein